MVKRHVRSATLLIIREMQIKTTIRHHLTSTKITKIKKTRNDKCYEDVEKKNHQALLVGMQTDAATVETVQSFFKKLKI